jgi:hypothetical protein
MAKGRYGREGKLICRKTPREMWSRNGPSGHAVQRLRWTLESSEFVPLSRPEKSPLIEALREHMQCEQNLNGNLRS